MNNPLSHFVSLARKGDSSMASTGEQKAHELAMCVLANAEGLDEQAVDGLKSFITLAACYHTDAWKLMHGTRLEPEDKK